MSSYHSHFILLTVCNTYLKADSIVENFLSLSLFLVDVDFFVANWLANLFPSLMPGNESSIVCLIYWNYN